MKAAATMVMLAVAGCTALPVIGQPAPTIHVTLSLQDEQANPLYPFRFALFTPGNAEHIVSVGSTGEVEVDVNKNVDDLRLGVRLLGPLPQSGMSLQDRLDAVNAFRAFAKDRAFRRLYVQPLEAGATAITVPLVVGPAVRVTGRLIDPAGAPVKGLTWVRDASLSAMGQTDQNGQFETGGLPINTTGELYALSNNGVVVMQQLLASTVTIPLGDITIPNLTGDGTVAITVAETALPSRLEPAGLGVTLVRESDALTLLFVAVAPGRVIDSQGGPPVIPTGTYFVVPGLVSADEYQLKVIDATRAQVELPGASMPRITVVSGQNASLLFDAAAADAAIRSMGQWNSDPDRRAGWQFCQP